MKWKLSDEYYIRLNWKGKTDKQCQAFLNKSEKSISAWRAKRGLYKVPNWSRFEILLLLTHGATVTAELTGKTVNACKVKLSRCTRAKSFTMPQIQESDMEKPKELAA